MVSYLIHNDSLIQLATILLQNATVITKCHIYYKFRQYNYNSPLALFSRRYHLLVISTDTLNNCSPGFRLLFVKCFGFALRKCWRVFQDLNFTMMRLNFFPGVFISSKFYGLDQYFHLQMEKSLHNRSLFDSFQHEQNEREF